jgi:hypothetical protein
MATNYEQHPDYVYYKAIAGSEAARMLTERDWIIEELNKRIDFLQRFAQQADYRLYLYKLKLADLGIDPQSI